MMPQTHAGRSTGSGDAGNTDACPQGHPQSHGHTSTLVGSHAPLEFRSVSRLILRQPLGEGSDHDSHLTEGKAEAL